MHKKDFLREFNINSLIEKSIIITTVPPDESGFDPVLSEYGETLKKIENICCYISSTSVNQITLQSGYYDDFTFDFGWTVSGGVTSPNDGIWQRGNPEGTDYNGTSFNPENDISNDCYDYAYVTGLEAGSQVGDRDVDDANTILTSPIFDLSNPLTNQGSSVLVSSVPFIFPQYNPLCSRITT